MKEKKVTITMTIDEWEATKKSVEKSIGNDDNAFNGKLLKIEFNYEKLEYNE